MSTTAVKTTTTKTTARKATTVKASGAMIDAIVSKAQSVRPTDTMLRAALTSLGADSALTFEAGRTSLSASDRTAGAAGVVAFAHAEGIGVEKGTVREIAAGLGVSTGQAAALIITGRVLGMLGSDAGKVLSATEAKAFSGARVPAEKRTAILDAANVGTVTGRKAFAKAVRSALAEKAESDKATRAASGKASAEGDSEQSSTMDVSRAGFAKIFSEVSARLAKIDDRTRWTPEVVAAWNALQAQVERVAALPVK